MPFIHCAFASRQSSSSSPRAPRFPWTSAAPEERAGRVRGAAAIGLAALCWGTTGTAAAFAPAAASSVSVGAARVVSGGLLLALAGLGLRSRDAGWPALRAAGPRALGAAGVSGIAVAAYQLFFFAAVSRAGVAAGTVTAIGSAPVFTGVLARVLLRSPVSRRWAAATVGAVTGCAMLIIGGHASGGAQAAQRTGIALALAAGAAYALYGVLASGLIRSGLAPRTVMGAIFGVGAVLLTPVLAVSSPGWIASPRGLAVTAYLAVVATLLGYLLYGSGLRVTPVAAAATLTLAEPATAAVLGVAVLGEHLTAVATAGLAFLGASLAALTLRRRRGELRD